MDTPQTPARPDSSGVAAAFLSMPDPFSTYIGLEFVEVTGSRVVATWAGKPELHQPFGIVHGGVHCSVVETLGSVGSAVWLSESEAGAGAHCVGVNNNTDFYRSISEGGLTSTATPLHQGRSQQVWVVETVRDADGKLIARGQLRVQNLYPTS